MPTTYAIPNGATVFAATTYTGNGGTQALTNGGNNTLGTTFKPDLIWIKQRNTVRDNQLQDSVRGASLSLQSNTTSAESNYGLISSINSNGFTVFTNGTYLASNENGGTYVAWQWKAGAGTTSSNTSGSITSTVSVNTTAGFSVVTYTGTGANATVGHGLGVAPSMIIVKNRTSGTPSWRVYHSALPYTSYLYLDTTNAAFTGGGVWTQTPSSTVFGINGSDAGVDTNGANYVAYCWAQVAGFSKFGSYIGNGSTDGPFVFCGFRPRYILIKNPAISSNWIVEDTSRSTYNQTANALYPNLSNAEDTSYPIDILSNGFKIRSTDVSDNGSGNTIIYAAFAENPFKYANAR
jgi:hypothetical protein